jgi:hypothetical protein
MPTAELASSVKIKSLQHLVVWLDTVFFKRFKMFNYVIIVLVVYFGSESITPLEFTWRFAVRIVNTVHSYRTVN